MYSLLPGYHLYNVAVKILPWLMVMNPFLPVLPSLQCSCKDITMANGYVPLPTWVTLFTMYIAVKILPWLMVMSPFLPGLPCLLCHCKYITMANGYVPLPPWVTLFTMSL